MRRIFTYSFASVLVVIYILSYVGFGVHKCTCNGTTDIILLFGDLSCENIHAHIHLSSLLSHNETEDAHHHHHTCSHEHSDNCCHTEVIALDLDQDIRDHSTSLFCAPSNSDFSFPLYALLPDFSFIQNTFSVLFREYVPPMTVLETNSLSILSVWRL